MYTNKKENPRDKEIQNDTKGRRSFIKKVGLGGLSLAGLTAASANEQLSYVSQNVNRNSSPSTLKITDMRIAEIGGDVAFRTPIVRIYTNQGIVGHGDVRDGAAKEYALFLKSRFT